MAGIPKLEDCKPGIKPTGFNVLVVIRDVEDKRRGLYLPDSVIDKERMIEVQGRIVAMSPAAFDFAEWPEGGRPKVGDAVQIAKMGGIMTTGADGREYRILTDKDVAAVIDEAAFDGPIAGFGWDPREGRAVQNQGATA